MKSSMWTRLGPLAAAVFLLIGAAWQLGKGGDSNSAYAIVLVSAAMITLGSWLTIEVWHHHDTSRQPVGFSEDPAAKEGDEGVED